MKRKFDNPKRYFYALLIAIFLVGLGFLISHSISSWEFQRTSVLQEKIYYDFYSTEVYYNLFEDKQCSLLYLNEIGESLDFQGQMISQFEEKFGKDNDYIKERKNYYYLLELSHFDFTKKIDEDCNFEHNFIFFFYSNKEEYLDESENAGKLISQVKKNIKNTYVYSFDIDSDIRLVNSLMKKYDINSVPVVILNEETKIKDFSNIDNIQEHLN